MAAMSIRLAASEESLKSLSEASKAAQQALDAHGIRTADVEGQLDPMVMRAAATDHRLDGISARTADAEARLAELAGPAAEQAATSIQLARQVDEGRAQSKQTTDSMEASITSLQHACQASDCRLGATEAHVAEFSSSLQHNLRDLVGDLGKCKAQLAALEGALPALQEGVRAAKITQEAHQVWLSPGKQGAAACKMLSTCMPCLSGLDQVI